VCEQPGGRVVPVESAQTRPDPDGPLSILEEGIDPAVVDAVGIIGCRPEYLECITIITVQAILRANPDEALPILQDAIYHTLRKSSGYPDPPEADVQSRFRERSGGGKRGGGRWRCGSRWKRVGAGPRDRIAAPDHPDQADNECYQRI